MLIVPILPETWMGAAAGVAPSVPVSATGTDAAELAGPIVKTAVATTPELMVLAFMPVTRQVFDPATALQLTDFPAAVAAGPAEIVTPVKFAVE